VTIPVSVVIPAYNSALFIEDTLSCVVAQTLKGFEVIVVDDGSTDGTADTAERFLAEHRGDFSFRVVRSGGNRGVSHARNTGIRLARGAYLFFLDSDDGIEPTCLQTLHAAAVKHGAETVFCSFDEFVRRGEALEKIATHAMETNATDPMFTGQEVLFPYFRRRRIFHLGSILTSRRLIMDNGLRFSEGVRYGEDVEFKVKVLIHAKAAVDVPEVLFHYVRRSRSITGSAPADPHYFLTEPWYAHVMEHLEENAARPGLLDTFRYRWMPIDISSRRRRLPSDTHFSREASVHLSSLARTYPYRVDSFRARDVYYWMDNRILAYLPRAYPAWQGAVEAAKRLSHRLSGTLERAPAQPD